MLGVDQGPNLEHVDGLTLHKQRWKSAEHDDGAKRQTNGGLKGDKNTNEENRTLFFKLLHNLYRRNMKKTQLFFRFGLNGI